MKKFGLLGEKLSHSYSSKIHNYLFQKNNIAASYSLLECKEEELASYIQMLKAGIYHGFNVTIPYKKTILNYLDSIDEKAKRIGSVNTIYLRDGRVCGTNTDYDGFLEMLRFYQVDPKGQECYVLGTGGAALSIATVLKDLGGNVTLVSRTPKSNQISYTELSSKNIDILINTTPVGMYPNIEECPVNREIIQNSKIVMDIIFNPTQTQFLQYANSKMNGLHMLVMQAIRAEEIWHGKELKMELMELLQSL